MKLFLIGAAITIISWIEAWGKFTPLHIYAFFPLWFGYFLTINGVSEWLFKNSLLKKMGWNILWLFIISIPFWRLFELLNSFTGNWQYQISGQSNSLLRFLLGNLFFSTVVPAVSSTTYLVLRIITEIKPIKSNYFKINLWIPLVLLELGVLSAILIYLYPGYSFPLLWGSVFFIFEPVNYFLGFPSIMRQINRGSWNIALAVVVAAFFTGFWWELWNYYSFPKWTYFVPYIGSFKVFEMPILGYVGYPFFGLEMFSFSAFFFGLLKSRFKVFHFEDYFLK